MSDAKVSVKIYESTRDQLELRKIEIRQRTGKKLDYADLIRDGVEHPAAAAVSAGPQLVVRPDSMKRLQAVAKHRHAELHALLNLALDEWLDGVGGEKPSLVPTGPNFRRTKHAEAHELLEIIMTEGNANDVGWITGNLVNFVEAIRSRKLKTAKRA